MAFLTGLSLPDLTERRLAPELMDSPTLDRVRHLGALDALARVNRVSLSVARVWKEAVRLSRSGTNAVRILDLACGGGDLLTAVARRAARVGLAVECHGCDASPVALDRARSLGGDRLGIAYSRLDVLRDPLPSDYDLVCSTLFLHHLDRNSVIHLLGAMATATRRVMLVQDLRRTRLGYVFARVGLGLLTRSDVARHDGLVSVEAALTLGEAESLCREAGLEAAAIRPCWPQRFVLRWERP